MVNDAEQQRLEEDRNRVALWRRWGPTSLRVSGARCARTTATAATRGTTSPTSTHGRAPTAGARTASRDLRPPADLCLALALWNGNDPILKERPFGLTNAEGNHGEDVKEYWWARTRRRPTRTCGGSTSTRSARSRTASWSPEPRAAARARPELELVDTGVFDGGRYFDIERRRTRSARRTNLHADRGDEPRTRRRAAAHPPDTVVPQHLVVGTRRPSAPCAASRGQRDRGDARFARPHAARDSSCRGRARSPLLRQRDEPRAALSDHPTRRRTQRRASTITSSPAPRP